MLKIIEFKKIDADSLKALVCQFRNIRPLYDNFYNFNYCGFDYFCSELTLLVKKQYLGFYRLYIISKNEADLSNLLKTIGSGCAINIPSRTNIDNWRNLLLENGFVFIGEYIRWVFNDLRKGDTQIKYATDKHCEQIFNLLYITFDKITDTLPNREELLNCIKNNEVIINEVDNKITGLLIYSIVNNVFYFKEWLDDNGTGISLFFNAFSIIEKLGIKRVYSWTNINNQISNKIHELMGGCRDGLKDYTFIKTNNNEQNN